HARPYDTLFAADIRTPTVCLWHESDFADALPHGLDLVLCGHSHGGQFCTPWGRPFMTADFGGRRLAGLYTDTPSPTYVSRGLATTGPPSRWNCPPESAILTIRPSRTGQPWLSEGG
ncbi:MAG: hypothetical protein MH204_03280, partial [Fimbriimonadaceae bacterium]|nr:hypothetical protein [Fimbriimonadaceae bacterium]